MEIAGKVERLIPDRVAESVERFTPRMPSSVYFGIAVGAMALLLWSILGMYVDFSDQRAQALRWRRAGPHPPGV
jgi:hypothetical protein